MLEYTVKQLRGMLIDRRQDVFSRLQRLESDWQALGDRDIELEEEAQKADLTSLFDQLDELEKQEIEDIDLALCKLAAGTYGSCEHCGKPISIKRLETIPATRLCRKCAHHFEETKQKLPRAYKIIYKANPPVEFDTLSDEEVLQIIWEHLRELKELDLEELDITYHKGVVFLDGLLPNESEHLRLREILTEVMKLSTLVDRLRLDEVAWEREDRSPGRQRTPADVKEYVPLEKNQTDDLFESQEEGLPYICPDKPHEE